MRFPPRFDVLGIECLASRIATLIERIELMAVDLETLKAQVAKNNDVIQSAITLINGISDRIAAAGTDPDALAKIVSDLDGQDQALARAVAANTPASSSPAGATGATGPAPSPAPSATPDQSQPPVSPAPSTSQPA